MTVYASWQGRAYEDFHPGDLYQHAVGRTVTQTDNSWFTLLTVNNNPLRQPLCFLNDLVKIEAAGVDVLFHGFGYLVADRLVPAHARAQDMAGDL